MLEDVVWRATTNEAKVHRDAIIIQSAVPDWWIVSKADPDRASPPLGLEWFGNRDLVDRNRCTRPTYSESLLMVKLARDDEEIGQCRMRLMQPQTAV